jgi:hypothetical protein
MLFVNGAAMLSLSQYFYCTKNNENELGANEETCTLFTSMLYSPTISALPTSLSR